MACRSADLRMGQPYCSRQSRPDIIWYCGESAVTDGHTTYWRHKMHVGVTLVHQTLHCHTHLVYGAQRLHPTPPRKLVHVPVQIFGLDMVERPAVPAPWQDPERLRPVGVYSTQDVLTAAVVDHMVVLQTVVGLCYRR